MLQPEPAIGNGDRNAGVICSGSIVFDIVARPVDESVWGTTTFVESLEFHPGGNGANTSVALATLAIPVRLLGAIGRDAQGSFISERLCKCGIDTSGVMVVDEPTAATVVIVNTSGAHKFLHRRGASDVAFAEPINFALDLICSMSHYHLASFFIMPRLRTHAAENLARARSAGLTTSLDTNWDPSGRWMHDLAPCLPGLDVLFLNEDEAKMLTGSACSSTAADVVLAQGVRVAIMKLGARGCAIYVHDREILCPAFEVEAADTTGAGDCFAGGFLAARLRGVPLAEAGRFANALAAMTVQRIGAVSGVASYSKVLTWMSTARIRATPAVRKDASRQAAGESRL